MMNFEEIIIEPTDTDPPIDNGDYTPPPKTDDPMMDAYYWFRDIAAEFADKPENYVMRWINGTAPLVSAALFASMYTQALALLTAHRLKMKQKAENAAQGISPVKSISEDGASLSFNLPSATLGANEETYRLTAYGLAFLEIRDKFYIGGITA